MVNGKIYSRKNPLKGIYKITCLSSNKYYIGSSINVVRRFQSHMRDLKANRHINPILQNTYLKYGRESFLYEVIEEVTIGTYEELLILEQHYLDTLHPELNIRTDTLVPPRTVTKVQKYSHEGIFIKEYESVVDAASELNIEPQSIFAVLSGIKSQVGGFLWTSVPGIFPTSIEPLKINFSGTNGISEFWKKGEYVIVKKDKVTGEVLHAYTKLEILLKDLKVTRDNVMAHLNNRHKTCAGFILECEEFDYVKSFKAGIAKKTIKLSENMVELETFPSASAAARSVGIHKSGILNAIRGKSKSAGFFWKYSE